MGTNKHNHKNNQAMLQASEKERKRQSLDKFACVCFCQCVLLEFLLLEEFLK